MLIIYLNYAFCFLNKLLSILLYCYYYYYYYYYILNILIITGAFTNKLANILLRSVCSKNLRRGCIIIICTPRWVIPPHDCTEQCEQKSSDAVVSARHIFNTSDAICRPHNIYFYHHYYFPIAPSPCNIMFVCRSHRFHIIRAHNKIVIIWNKIKYAVYA